ncbi:catalase family peroxidase [Streptomyces sp. NPDC059918]|uniref:catalase family peroxidase n=1 Tax=unclassified Streptomyces TaxID=2593676 RepID=UPI003652AC64
MTSHEVNQAVSAVDGIEELMPPVPGLRRVHGKGVCYDGVFVSHGTCAPYTTAAHLAQGARTPVVVRFSNGRSATAPDGSKGGRGMAVRFLLPDGTSTDLIGLNSPTFFAATPGQLLELIATLKPDPITGVPDQERFAAFFRAHPGSLTAIQRGGESPTPVSYATLAYWAVHAFGWVSADGVRRHVKYRWEPEAGIRHLSEEEAAAMPADFLDDELRDRVGKETVRLTLLVQFAQDGDPTDDPTVEWPADREEIVAGHLELTGRSDDQEEWERAVFDPTNLTPGIERSDDPLLAIRHHAYAVSHQRRIRERGAAPRTAG